MNQDLPTHIDRKPLSPRPQSPIKSILRSSSLSPTGAKTRDPLGPIKLQTVYSIETNASTVKFKSDRFFALGHVQTHSQFYGIQAKPRLTEQDALAMIGQRLKAWSINKEQNDPTALESALLSVMIDYYESLKNPHSASLLSASSREDDWLYPDAHSSPTMYSGQLSKDDALVFSKSPVSKALSSFLWVTEYLAGSDQDINKIRLAEIQAHIQYLSDYGSSAGQIMDIALMLIGLVITVFCILLPVVPTLSTALMLSGFQGITLSLGASLLIFGGSLTASAAGLTALAAIGGTMGVVITAAGATLYGSHQQQGVSKALLDYVESAQLML